MKSTAENLRSICLRLIITSLILFVFTELVMAFMALFIFMPEKQKSVLKEKEQYLRVGIEATSTKDLNKQLISMKSAEIDHGLYDLSHGLEAIHGISSNVYDVVCTDFLAADYLVKNKLAVPLAYLKDEDNEIAWERLLLLGHKKVPEFLMQTKGLRLMLTGVSGKVERVVSEKFLHYKLKDINKWLSKVSVAMTVDYAMKLLTSKATDLVLILESDFKRMYNEEQRAAFKVIWYSEQLPSKVVVMRSNLSPELQSYSQQLFKGKNDLGEYWKPFDESLVTLKDWSFRISGKSFTYNKEIVNGFSGK